MDTHEIVDYVSRRCLTETRMDACASLPSQRFTFDSEGGGVFRLRVSGTTNCLAAQPTGLGLESCATTSPGQRFTLRYVEKHSAKFVFAHYIPVFPLTYDALNEHLGSMYPLSVVDSKVSSMQVAELAEMKSAALHGVNGFSVDTLPTMEQAERIRGLADEVPGFRVAPCLDFAAKGTMSAYDWALEAIRSYLSTAGEHPSVATIEGRPVIATYTQGGLSTAEWNELRAKLEHDGTPIHLLADTGVDFNGAPTPAVIEQRLTAVIDGFDMGYSFLMIPETYWPTYLSVFRAHDRPFAGGLMPGYYRGFNVPYPWGPFGWDSQGTAEYRRQIQQQIPEKLPLWHITTWNDYTEHTNIGISSDWSTTRAEITRWFAAIHRGGDLPFDDVRLYITSPQLLYLGEDAHVEALVLNPTASPVTVTVNVSPDGADPIATQTVTVAPRSSGDATLVLRLTTRSHPFLWPIGDAAGLHVRGAPILVRDTTRPDDDHAFGRYYSLAGRQKLDANVPLTRVGNTLRFDVPADLDIRFADVLHDTNKIVTLVDPVGAQNVTLPGVKGIGSTDNDYYLLHNGIDLGQYVLRLIDRSNRIWYSPPLTYRP